jgi:hypothetical protein
VQIQLKKKKQNKQIVLNYSISTGLLTLVTAYFIATKGFTYVKDNVMVIPTKECSNQNG